MKKGFTLVEMSIVLVIIGILMGMTVKGKQLIDSAKLRGDIAVIRNLQTQFNAYYADNGSRIIGEFTEKNLTAGKYATTADLVPKLATKNFTIVQVNVTEGSDGHFTKTKSGSTVAIVIDNEDRVIGCKVDTTIDDMKSASGKVRAIKGLTGNKDGSETDIEFNDCQKNEATLPQYAVLVD